MKLLVDCRYTRIDHHDGISRYTAGIVDALARLHPVIMLINDERQLALLPDLPWTKIGSPTSPLEPLVARQVNTLKPDVVFTPMQTMGSFGRHYRLVLTVHDLIYYRHRTPPRGLPWFIRAAWRLYHLSWWPQRMLLNRADAVVAVSQTTKALITEHRLTRRPIGVVPNAADGTLAGWKPELRSNPATKSLVYMGSFMPYKNVDTLVRAMSQLPDYELHLMSRVTDAERERLTRLAPNARLTFHNGASDDEYAATLLACTALVTLSRDEGFGIPVIEAMRLGIPAIVSDIPIFREIGADAALYVNPDAPTALVHAVRDLEQPGEWERRSRRSPEIAARYSWDASARALLDVLTAVAKPASDH